LEKCCPSVPPNKKNALIPHEATIRKNHFAIENYQTVRLHSIGVIVKKTIGKMSAISGPKIQQRALQII
jgi:hypothetical protein